MPLSLSSFSRATPDRLADRIWRHVCAGAMEGGGGRHVLNAVFVRLSTTRSRKDVVQGGRGGTHALHVAIRPWVMRPQEDGALVLGISGINRR